MHHITLIRGDGIGPEICEATIKVINASGVNIKWDEVIAGQEALNSCGTPLPEETISAIKKSGMVLKGPLTTEVGTGFRSINVALRKEFNLYINLRPVKSFHGVNSIYQNIDLVVVRENTEDLYSGVEHMVGEDAAESIKIITRRASERVARFAFDYAVKNDREKVTAVHKANIMKLSDGLFLESVKDVAKDYEQIQFEDLIVDNVAMQLVLNPHQFDVLVAPNLYGDILSDLCAGLIGGLGLTPGINIGENVSVFEPVHGSAPDLAGKNLANPTAMILSAIFMLHQLGEEDSAYRINEALTKLINEKEKTTPDLGGNCGTQEMAEALIAKIKNC